MNKFCLVVFFLLANYVILAQNFNRPLPNNHPGYEFNQNGTGAGNYYYLTGLFKARPSPDNEGVMSVMDKEGYVKWYSRSLQKFQLGLEYNPQHQVFSYIQSGLLPTDFNFFVLDTNFNIVDSILPANGVTIDNHDFRILANGNYLITGAKDSLVDLSAYVFNGVSGNDSTTIKGFVLQEFDSNKNLVFEWNSNDHIHPSNFIDGYPYDPNSFDYAHGNAVEVDSDGNLLISLRHTDAIYKINKVTGNIMWTLGGTSNQFTFTNDIGFSGQHDIRRLPNGNITLFDNANNAVAPKISRGVEYMMDTVSMTCTRVWESVYTFPFFARAMGSNRSLDNGERIAGYGFSYRPNPNFVHYDANDNIISEIFYEDTVMTYRALISELPFNFNQPVINCFDNNGSVVLVAPSGYNSYEWSTGESTQSIVVADTGTYQLWVNQGIGMVGSNPMHISDLSNPCGIVGIDDLSTQNNSKKIKAVFDFLGREIQHPIANQLYVIKYNNGISKIIQWKTFYQINE